MSYIYIAAMISFILVLTCYLNKQLMASKEEAIFISVIGLYSMVLFFIRYSITYKSTLMLMVVYALLNIAFIDLKYKLIPNRMILALLILAIAFVIDNNDLFFHLFGLLFAFLFCFFIYVISKGSFGGGDVKLISVLGLVLGFYNIFIVLLISFLLAFVSGIIKILSGKMKFNEPVPFGPFIVIAFVFISFI